MAAPLASEALVPTETASSWQQRLAAAGCCTLCGIAIWTVLADAWASRVCSAIAFIAFLVTAQGYFGLRERLLQLLAFIAALAAVFLLGAGAVEPIVDDLSRAAYLGAFMMLITALRQGAFGSESVLTIGRYLTSQPPGRRYFALHVGGHLMGVLLNFGAITLLGPLVRRGVDAKREDGPPELSEIRLRRQISALSRGFSWFHLWAPTAVSQAVVLSVVPGAKAAVFAGCGVIIALLLLVAGSIEDRATGYRARMRLVGAGLDIHRESAPAFPWTSLVRFLTVGATLIGTAWIVSRVTGLPLVSGIMIAAVPVNILWVLVQMSFRMTSVARRMQALFGTVIPSGSPEAATLGLAGFIGILAATLVDRSWLADGIANWLPGPGVIYLAVSAIIPLCSCIGLPPMMTVTFLAGLLTSLPHLQLDPSILGLSLLVGWALNLTGSPFGASSLLLWRVAGIPGTLHAWRWNGLFTIVSWCVAAAVILVAAQWL